MLSLRYLIVVPLALSGCVAPRAPAPQPPPLSPPPRPLPPPAPVAADWTVRTPAVGTWTYSQDARGSMARYGPPGGDALFTLRCDRASGRIVASRPGMTAARMTLGSTHGARAYDAQPMGGQPLQVAAQLAARDPQLDAMAFSRGRILIGLAGAPDLVLPIWPEFTRVVEDCRG